MNPPTADKDEKACQLSRNEEHEAIEIYEHRRKEVTDPKLRKALEHAISEEIEHEKLFNDWLAEHEEKENRIKV